MSDGKVKIDVDLNKTDADRSVDDLDRKLKGLEGAGSKGALGIGKIVAGLGLVKVASKVFGMIKGSISSAFGRIDTMESFQRVMTAITGDSKVAGQTLDQLKVITKGTAYGLDTAAKAVQGFVTRGVDIPKATKYFEAFGDAVAFYGDGSKEQLENVTDALGKMLSKGKVSMDQLDRLTDAGIDGVGTYAKATGKSVESVQDDLSKGAISAEDFVDTVSTAFQEGTNGVLKISGAAKNAGATWGAVFTNMKAATTRGVLAIIEAIDKGLKDIGLQDMRSLVASFGDVMETMLTNVAAKIPPVIKFIKNMIDTLKPFAPIIMGVVAAILTFSTGISVVDGVTKSFTKLKDGFDILKGAMATHPVLLVIAALVGLGVALYTAYQKSETFRNAVNKIAGSLKQFTVPIGNAVKGLKIFGELLKTILTGNALPAEMEKLKSSFTKMFPESLWKSMTNFAWKINDIKLAIKAIAGIVTGSIKSFDDLDDVLGGTFGKAGTKNIKAIGDTIKLVIDRFKGLLSPAKSAGKSIDLLKVGFAILKAAALALLGPIGLVIKIISLVAKALGGGDVKAGIQKMLDGFSSLAKGVNEAGSQVGANVGDMLAGILKAIGAALPGIISGALSIIAGFLSGLAQGLPQVALAAVQLIAAFTGSMLMLIPTIAASATLIIVTLLGSLAAGLPQIILAGINLLVSLIAGLTAGMPQFVLAVANLIVVFLASIAASLPRILLAGTNLLIAFLQGLIDNLPKIVETVGTLITTFLDAITAKLPSIITSGTNLLVAWLKGIADNLPKVISAAVDVIVAFLNGIAKELPRIVTSAVNLIASFLQGIADNLYKIVNAAVNVIISFLQGIADKIPDIVSAAWDVIDALVQGILDSQYRLTNAIIDLMNGMARNITNSAPQMKTAAAGLLTAMIGALPGGGLINAGLALAGGLLGGLKTGFEKVKTTVSGWATWIKKNKGPISYDKKLLVEAGNAIVYGLNRGLLNSFDSVKNTVLSLTGMIDDTFSKGIKDVSLDANLNTRLSSSMDKNLSKIMMPRMSAEAALGIGGRMSTSPNSVMNSNVTNNYTTAKEDTEVVRLLKVIANKPFLAEIDGKRVTKAISQEMDKSQGNRIKLSDWGIEING